jgi:hypothetical protein
MSLLTDPTSTLERDTCLRLKLSRLVGKPPQQPCASPLGDLAVLVLAPAVLATELGATLACELACQHEPLIARERVRESSDAAQIVAQEGQLLDVSMCVGHLHPSARAAGDVKRACQRCLDRAAPTQRTAAIVDAREELLLERIGDVDGVGESFSASGPGQQLERRLAVAVL